MKVRLIYDEWFQDYKEPSMFICATRCDWKCCKEQNNDICQNMDVVKNTIPYEISSCELLDRYKNNPITKAVIIGGLEPMLQIDEVCDLIKYFRDAEISDFFVVYTGYYENETTTNIEKLKQFKNVIVKFGRFIPNQEPHFDGVLGCDLASDNQYAKKIS